jgi:hypothetical protein
VELIIVLVNFNNFSVHLIDLEASLRAHSLLFQRETRQATHVFRNIEARSCNQCCMEKVISIIYSECVFVALGMQCACAVFSSLACPTIPHFSTLSH